MKYVNHNARQSQSEHKAEQNWNLPPSPSQLIAKGLVGPTSCPPSGFRSEVRPQKIRNSVRGPAKKTHTLGFVPVWEFKDLAIKFPIAAYLYQGAPKFHRQYKSPSPAPLAQPSPNLGECLSEAHSCSMRIHATEHREYEVSYPSSGRWRTTSDEHIHPLRRREYSRIEQIMNPVSKTLRHLRVGLTEWFLLDGSPADVDGVAQNQHRTIDPKKFGQLVPAP